MVFLWLYDMGDFFSYGISFEYKVIRVVNTYAWIIEIADSNIVKIICMGKIIIIMLIVFKLPKSVIRRWPAIILAVNRTDNDIGRIKFPILSIMIIIGIIMYGVPEGKRWINIEL